MRMQTRLLLGVVMIFARPPLSAQTNRDVAIGTVIVKHIAAEFPSSEVLGVESTDQPSLAREIAFAAKGRAIPMAEARVCDQQLKNCRVKDVDALVRLRLPLRLKGDTVSLDVDLWWNPSDPTGSSLTSRRRYRLAQTRGTWQIIDVKGIFTT